MARTGSSSKFVPVNLNNSYGQTLPLSNGGTSASSGLGRSRSFNNSYGGMVSLSRPSRVASSTSSSATVSRTSKLAVPGPVNLPSLRREHSGNDPTIALVGSVGSSGWNKQSGDESADANASRSDAAKGDATSWGNRASAADGSSQAAEKRLLSGGRQSTYSPSGLGDTPVYSISVAPAPVTKAVVFRGEDFPTLQAAAAPPSPSLPPPARIKDSQQKQRDRTPGFVYKDDLSPQKEPFSGDDRRESNHFLNRQLQPAQPVRMHARSNLLDQPADDVERGSAYHRGPSPLIKLTHTSNWADDERETLSSVRTQDYAQHSDRGERNDGFHMTGDRSSDRNADMDSRRPASRVGNPGRNELDFSTKTMPASQFVYPRNGDSRRDQFVYPRNGDSRRDHLNGGRFENNVREDFERSSNNFGRNDILKRCWSFSAADSNLNRDVRYASPSNRLGQDGYPSERAYYREGNNAGHDASRRNISSQNARPGSHYQDGGQWHDSKFGQDVFLGRQGFPGSILASGPRSVRGVGFSFSGPDVKSQPGMDYKREKRVSGYYGQVHSEDPFLGDGISSRPPAFYVSQPKIKKDSLNPSDYRDPARESFEAELERVEKMLEQERQRVIEERERAIELARKEQEEQERIAREEEELRLKLEEEAREAKYRAQKEAEEAARKVEEARKAREEEKRMAEFEEERRKEAARRKLLDLEERMAKRELEKRQEVNSGSPSRTETKDVSMDSQEDGLRKNDSNRDSHWKLLSSPSKANEDPEQVPFKAQVSGSTSRPSILRSPVMTPVVKEESTFPTEGGRFAQTWKRDTSTSGLEPRSAHKGPPKFLHLRSGRSQQDNEEQQRPPLLRNVNAQKSPVRSNESRASDDAEEREWWVRNTDRSFTAYSQNSDFSEYPSYGRIRQSLPRQPRVLPPPPGNSISRKQAVQIDETHFGGSPDGTKYAEGPLPVDEENRLPTGDETAREGDQEANLSEQFDAVTSEEFVLSDAGSQFSDDTVEDVAAQAEHEQEPHSDVVSETYTDREVDEISDFEAQESSEEGESQKTADWEVCQGDQNQECVVESLEEVRIEVLGLSSGQPDVGKGGFINCTEVKDEDVEGEVAEDVDSSSLVEDAGNANLATPIHDAPISEQVERQTAGPNDLQNGQAAVTKAEELVLERRVQDQEVHPFLNQPSFLPVVTNDVAQIRHLEGLSSRQALVQPFQQPFSFMAVSVPQPGTLNHTGASLPTLSSLHTLSNQQELPFHLQLGLLPSVALLPNAIQIGSIQMPLHIHPQSPQLNHLHGHQQAPVFQFGQIGPSLALSQPMPMTQMAPSPMQMPNTLGQNILGHHSQSQVKVVATEDTNINSADCSGHRNLENAAVVKATPIVFAGQDLALPEHVEIASGNSHGSTIATGIDIELCAVEPNMKQVATGAVSKFDAQTSKKIGANDKLESTWVGDNSEAEYNARPPGKHSRGGRRSNSRYQGILGRGQGRFHGRGGQHYSYQASQSASESWPEGGAKRFSRGKMFRRNYRRAEYRVREPTALFDPDTAVPDSPSGPAPNTEDTKEGGGYRYVKRGSRGHPTNAGDEKGQLVEDAPHSSLQITANPQSHNQSVASRMTKSKNLLKKYEVENAEDASFRTGVVCVFEQPGIETPNDKDDFVKVRSKRQLLRELREQREKEIKLKNQDAGSKDTGSKKQQRSTGKIGVGSGMLAPNSSRNMVKRRSIHNDGKSSAPGFANGTTAISLATSTKKSSTPSKVGRVASASKAATLESDGITGHGNDNHASQHSMTAAWGGQRSNHEVVSLTQIQLEEAMKPFRLEVPFSESVHSPEKAIPTLDSILPCSASLSVEKTVSPVKASGPLSSLLAGEKIQFGAVTSPTLNPPDNCPPTPASALRTGSPIDFGSNPPHISSHASNFVTDFLNSHLDATYSLKGESERKDDCYGAKVVDLEAEAAAEAAASAVLAAAINSEDLIERHSNSRVSEMNVGCSAMSSVSSAANTMSGQINCASDNPIAVALPADLSVEMPSSLFQGSSMTLSNSSGVVLQSLQNGAPTFPCLEMGPLIGGPVFNFGPREDASMASLEPGLSGWQQRHMGAPDSFYGAPPFLSPAGLSSIQGHPHMLVYANPYTPVGQFGQVGLSFMGAAYHPSGKQPDWTHVPIPLDGDISAGSTGLMNSQHHNGASNLLQTQRVPIAGSSVMSVATPPNLFDTGYAAPFQVPQIGGLVQSHWSKAPAPPVHSVSIGGSTLPPLSRPAVDLNVQVHPPRTLAGHPTNLIDGTSGFHQQLSMMSPITRSSFSSATDACSQFPDELGLGDSLLAISNVRSDANGTLSDAGHLSPGSLIETPSMRGQRSRHLSRNSQGQVNSANGGEQISNASYQEQKRSGVVAVDTHDPQGKSVGRIGSPRMRNTAMPTLEQRTLKQAVPRDNAGGDWARGSQRKGAPGRLSNSERGGSSLPSKLKQVYVAKPTGDSRNLSAAC